MLNTLFIAAQLMTQPQSQSGTASSGQPEAIDVGGTKLSSIPASSRSTPKTK